MEERKQLEIEFHNQLRGEELKKDPLIYEYYTSNERFYSVDRANREYCEQWLREQSTNKRVLDYCCGEGDYSLAAARFGAQVVGIDISDVCIEVSRERARGEGLEQKTSFLVMDAETLGFEDNTFDLIICAGVLHHVDLQTANIELARVLKPDGQIICMEALRHNPIIHWYRKRTPHLRTEYEAEHILKMSDVEGTRRSFEKVEVKFFHLATLAAVPFRNLPGFRFLLGLLEAVDSVLLRLPIIQKQAWMVVFVLSEPKKGVLPFFM